MARFRKSSLVRRIALASCAWLSASTLAEPAGAATFNYVDWLAADVPAGTASGVITLPDSSTVTVSFSAIGADGGTGVLHGAQVGAGTNYWNPATPFMSSEVENAPPTPDILQLRGGLNATYVVTLSEPIKDPVMAIVSLGQASVPTTYDFDSPFTIVSQGAGYWGGSATALTALEGDVLEGREGHGTIRFIGTFARFSWTVPTPEQWHGFTFAIRTTERLEPTPDAGGDADADASTTPDGAGGSAGAAGGGAGGGAGAGSGGGGRGGTTAGPDASTGSPDKDDSGCNCALPKGSPGSLSAVAALAGGVAFLRMRRRVQRRVLSRRCD